MDPRDKNALASFSGKRSENILDPSNGGMGIRLKIASKRFKRTISAIISNGNILRIKLKIIAIATLVRGPARETRARSFLPSLRLKGSTGTGLAAPIIIGEPEIKRIRGRAMLIMGSI